MTTTWSNFLQQISGTTRTRETVAEYKGLPKTKQDAIKDVGGFVGGWLKQGRRKADSLEHRSLITLTEYRIADLKGKTLRQRADQLIAVAHPDFRKALSAQYSKRGHCKVKMES